MWWNKRVNLVSRSVPRETIWEHIRHSLLIHRVKAFRQAQIVVDAGSGGGLPGIPLAICFPEKEYILNDIVTKKMMAVKQMVRHLDLHHVELSDASVSQLRVGDAFLLISKHSFKIPELIALSSSLPWTAMILYKGDDYTRELADLTDDPYDITAYRLQDDSDQSFYRNKFLITIRKKHP